ncbi:metallophosphoesterase [Carnobacterium gallinarum]|uniref:metallophosphoesterase n=1 Tax=Carnobacterium gallinarum TaxID=2749 RepID=UPI00054FCD4C|nr:metallophosphoesterase [Carnobacterium gallinarum]
MKVLVVSDNHGDRDVLVDLIQTYQGKVNQMFHCGDSELPSDDPIWEQMLSIRGNCDYDSAFPTSRVTKVDGETVLTVHGHLHDVKFTMDTLIYAAKEVGASFAFFGHTHELGVEMVDSILLLNPGSISLPRGRFSGTKTYAIIETTPELIQVTYYDRSHQPVDGLHFDFKR